MIKGLASIEAKRKYKAPQVNEKQSPILKESLPSNEESAIDDNVALSFFL